MANDRVVPRLSTPALQELRRIYCKRLLEVFASPETQELYDRGLIIGRFAPAANDDNLRSFVVERVTDLGVAALQDYENQTAAR